MGYRLRPLNVGFAYRRRQVFACLALAFLAGCSTLGGSGPSARSIQNAGKQAVGNADIKIIDVTDAVARQVQAHDRPVMFSQAFGDVPPMGTIIGPGDVLEVAIWESPPAVLFGSSTTLGGTGASPVMTGSGSLSQKTAIPELMVDTAGRIQIPFAGYIPVAGRTPREIEREIIRRLSGKAHDPQVMVRLAGNANANVTVMGDVGTSMRVALTPRGERLLDALASAGGVKEATSKMTIQVTRAGRVVALPLDNVIRDPSQNIRLQSDDVVTALYQPYTFTSLGATGNSAEVPFEATGLSLAQALGRVKGLKDDRADIRGVFLFRLENPEAVDPAVAATARLTPDGRIPVIYRVDLRNPATLFAAQSFPIRNRDVLYVSTAPLSDLQRFVSMISSTIFPIIALPQAIP